MRAFRFCVVVSLLVAVAASVGGLASPSAALAASTTCNSVVYDGYLTAWGATYGDVRDATEANQTIYLTTDFTVGQDYVNSTVYYISRVGLFFDTSQIPSNAVISSATVQMRGEYDDSEQDFDILLVRGPDLHTPMIDTDYGLLLQSVDTMSSNTVNSSSFSTDYMTWTLNDYGRNQIVRGGMTTMGVRSSRDISSIAPTAPLNREYLRFYSSEAGTGYRPILNVTYTIPGDIGDPTTLIVNSVAIFDNYKTDGDNLVTVEYKCMYSPVPTDPAGDWYFVQLLHEGTVLGETRLPNWGHAVTGLYIATGLEDSWTYTVKIAGDPVRFSGTPPSISYATVGSDWRGENLNLLDAWCRAAALRIGITYGTSITAYVEGTLRLDENGASLFLAGIPGLDRQRPNLFTTATVVPEDEDTEGYTPYAPGGELGDYVDTTLTNTGELFGITKNMLAGIVIVLMIGALIAMLKGYTGGPVGGIIIALPLIGVAAYFEIIPMAIIMIFAFFAVAMLGYQYWLTRTSG